MQTCSRCVFSETVPDLDLDQEGVCKYCRLYDRMCQEYPTGGEGMTRLRDLADRVREDGRGNEFDCVVGVSGGCDSSFLLWLTKEELQLRPLAVHFDNTWDSNTAVRNMNLVSKALGVKLDTFQAREEDLSEYTDIYLAFLKSGTPDIDCPTDVGLATVLYRKAEEHGVRHIFEGNCFRTEGVQPLGWTYMDGQYVADVAMKHSNREVRAFPNLWMADFKRWCEEGIQRHRPLYNYDYKKECAKEFLRRTFNWEWYGGHHLENVYTEFTYAYYLYKRFGIDGRLNGHAALVRSGQMTREAALAQLRTPPPYDHALLKDILDRFGLGDAEFDAILRGRKRTYRDYQTSKQQFEEEKPLWDEMRRRGCVPMSFIEKYCKPDTSSAPWEREASRTADE